MRRAAAALAVHRRLAVVLAFWVAFQSLTGLVLLFRDPIEHRTHPGLTRHGSGDRGAAAALDAVRGKYPDEPVGALATPAVSDGVYVIEVGDREVYVDPAAARINGSADHEAGFVALVERLHRRFLFDSVLGLSGERLVAGLGLAWLVLAITGLGSAAFGRIGGWWHRGRETGQWWRLLPAGARRRPPVLHRTIGLAVVAPMVLVAVTGVRLAVPAGSDRIWAALTGSGHGRYDTPPKRVTVTSDDRGGEPLDATKILAALERKYPDGQVARLLMPLPGDRAAPVIAGVSLGLDPGRGQHEYGGNTVVFLDQFSAGTLWVGRPGSLPAARQAVLLWSRPLHTGAFAGDAGRLAWGWMALAVVGLGLSGWAARRLRTVRARLETFPWRRQVGRRKVLARQERARARQAARQAARRRRTRTRRLRRRRTIRARSGIAVREPVSRPADPGRDNDASPPDAEFDLGPAAIEIDPRSADIDIDLTDDTVAVLYESEITLESGETLESGIVVPLRR
ncbi:MAG: hypothetical protein QOD57_3985 [Actinomycetota bacterium]|nr:hypothetical protein [Actinomycetota bacterium]